MTWFKQFSDHTRGISPAVVLFLLLGTGAMSLVSQRGHAQNALAPSSAIRIGEKLSYTVSFGRFPNAGYVETNVVSRGKLSGKEAIEIRSKMKTVDLVSAAFFLLDESRVIYIAPDSGLPLYIRTNSHDSALPKETISNFLTQPTTNFDLVSLIFKARETAGTGTFPLFEGTNSYTVSFIATVPEKIKTEAGDFDTTISTVQSDFLTANGIKDLRINFSTDEFHIPVLFRFKTAKGEFHAILSGLSVPEPDTPTPTPSPTPARTATPIQKPTATPAAYVENSALAPELGFQVGESLDYNISSAGRPVAKLNLSARERKLVGGVDSLMLVGTIIGIEQGNTDFHLGDSITAQVDPETLAPNSFTARLAAPYPGLNTSVLFDSKTGFIKYGPTSQIDAPMGTHSILSLIYAMRSFNLKPSKDRSNPVNDTRVAVFWDAQAYVFTLRPSESEMLTINGEKVSAQLITISTRHPQLDQLLPKVWLGTDDRVPVRFSVGRYQADLVVRNNTLTR